MLLTDVSFVVVDVETTGLSAMNHRITEIGMVRLTRSSKEDGWAMADSFHTLMNPDQYISPFITAHTGITNAMVYGKPKFHEIAQTIQNFMIPIPIPFQEFGARPLSVLAGHNVKFDHGFLVASFQRASAEFDPGLGMLCTCRLARRLLPQLRSKSLSSVQNYFGIRNARQHRALSDAEATAKILAHFIEMAQGMGIETVKEFLKLQNAKPNYAKRKTKRELSLREIVREFPERPGVYTMRSQYGNVLYVGKAKNLRDRVSSYFAPSHTDGTKLTQMMKAVREITYEETGSELSALLLESKKIKELRPKFNAMDRYYKPQSFMRLDVQTDFPELTFIREPEPDGAEYFGPFKSRDAAEALMEILNRAFKLRECGDKFRVGLNEKPCLYYEIKRCGAPCALLQTKEEYREEVTRLREFLAAGDEGILAHIEAIMRKAADDLNFEDAQFYKERWQELRRILGSGDREDASISGNDFVLLNPLLFKEGTGSGSVQCEALFVRFGRLVKQAILTPTYVPTLTQWAERQMRQYYGAVSAIPPSAGKPEVDEMRILTKWVDESKKKGSRIIYIGEVWEPSIEKLVAELKEMLQTETDTAIPPPRQQKLLLKPMKMV
jgi:DNA polymerase-3 subunit epsilon